jgi:hypothetical protein
MAHQIILVPAYGRVYASKEKALEAWDEGKDFRIQGGPYCSIRDIAALKRTNNHVLIQYTYVGFSEIFAV